MIRGSVNARWEAVLGLRVRGPSGADMSVDTVVDSGFTGSLTLPQATVRALGLARQSGGSAVLADATVRHFDVYAAEWEWEGNWRPILVSAVGDEALSGMRLLAGRQLRIDVALGGLVEVAPLP